MALALSLNCERQSFKNYTTFYEKSSRPFQQIRKEFPLTKWNTEQFKKSQKVTFLLNEEFR